MGEAGKPRRRAGQTASGVRREVEDGAGGEAARRGWESGDREGPADRLEKGGPSEGEEKREFKLLTLLVFFK